ncbi:MAG: hypothetical protein Tsb002_38580 [Wenzhouxiangellaceae bacterium]
MSQGMQWLGAGLCMIMLIAGCASRGDVEIVAAADLPVVDLPLDAACDAPGGLASDLVLVSDGKQPQSCGCTVNNQTAIATYYVKEVYKTKAECERKAPRDLMYNKAADAAFDSCMTNYACLDNCPNQRLGMPDIDDICSCTNNKSYIPPGVWVYNCDIKGKFNCCCVNEI